MPPTYTTPSTRYGIHRIDGSTNVSDIDAALNQSVDDIDARMAGYAEGTLSARSGVAATAGKLYRTTDTDFRGRTLVMPDGTAGRMASGDDRGAAGGEELHTLTLSELPAHVHTANGAPGGTTAAAGGAVGPFQNQQDGRSTSAIGSGSAHNNMPPYAVAGGVFIRIM
jgi:hypothetical protein